MLATRQSAGNDEGPQDEHLPRTVWHCVITTPLMYLIFFNREALSAAAAKKRAEYGWDSPTVLESVNEAQAEGNGIRTPFGEFGFDGPWSTALVVQFGISIIVGMRTNQKTREPAMKQPIRTNQSSVWLLRLVVLTDTFLGSLNSIAVIEYIRFSTKECTGFATLSECIRRRYFPSTHLSFLSKWLFSGLPVKLVIFPEFVRNVIFVVLSLRLQADEARAAGEPMAIWSTVVIIIEAVASFAVVNFCVALMRPGPVLGEMARVENCPTPWLRRARNRIEAAALGAAARNPAACHFVGACFAPGLTPLIVSVSIGMGFHSLHEMGYSINIFLLFVMVQQLFTLLNSVSAGFYVSSAFGVANRLEILDRMLGRSPAVDSPVGAHGMTKLWMVDKSELQLEDVIGTGSFSTVWRAQWRGSPVAVKVWHVVDSLGADGIVRRSSEIERSGMAGMGQMMEDTGSEDFLNRLGGAPDDGGVPGMAGAGRLSQELDPSVRGRAAAAAAAAASCEVRRASADIATTSRRSNSKGSMAAAFSDRPSTFLPEVELLLRLRHPNILTVFAVVTEPPMLVMALGASGTLHDVLVASTLETLPWARRLAVLRGVACGLAFLHTQAPPIYHMDLKARNVVMSASMEPQVADFGLSGPLLASAAAQAHPGPPKNAYAAPEVLLGEAISGAAVDMYGFGCVLNNTVVVGTQLGQAGAATGWGTGTAASWDAVQVAFKRIESGFALEVPAGCPPPLASLLTRCCAREPSMRPLMVDVLEELRGMVLAGCDGWWDPKEAVR